MNKDILLLGIEESIGRILFDEKFQNYKNELVAWNLNRSFERNFDEEYLWTRSLYLSTNCCILINESRGEKITTEALKICAEIYEYMHVVSEKYDRDYCVILSSLCYDISGYQANARCMISLIDSYNLISTDLSISLKYDNYIFKHLYLILKKNIDYARHEIDDSLNEEVGIKLFNEAIGKWYNHILNGKDSDYYEIITKTYEYYIEAMNITISNVMLLLRTRIFIYNSRSIWKVVRQSGVLINDNTWQKYLRLLTSDIYNKNFVKPIQSRVSKFEFWPSQLSAIKHGLLNKENNFIIQMPTSVGKTFIAELLILNYLIKYPTKQCVYVAPFRALTNEKEVELAEYLAKLGYTVSSISGGYELDIVQERIINQTDVLIATPEKIDLLLRNDSTFFNRVSLVVVDEGHIIGDLSPRASLLEFLIVRLRIKYPEIKYLFISAVMPPKNADVYSEWLNGSKEMVIRSLSNADTSIDKQWEPTRKLIGKFSWKGNDGEIEYDNLSTIDENLVITKAIFPSIIKKKQYLNKYPNNEKKFTSAVLGLDLSKNGHCLIFCAKPKDVLSVGKAISLILLTLDKKDILPDHVKSTKDKESYYYANKWFGPDHVFTKCIEYGVGVHFGDLPDIIRKSVENDFKIGLLKILISTNTIGQGLNFPIKYLIFHSSIMNIGIDYSIVKVTNRDFWNILGRTGRAGMETEGQLIFVVDSTEDEKAYRRYINKQNIEPAESIIYKFLKLTLEQRLSDITKERFENAMDLLLETYLLDILVEEMVETEDSNFIEKLIDNSLFKIQSDYNNLSTSLVYDSINRILTTTKAKLSKEQIALFAKTGLYIKSNLAMQDYIISRIDELKNIISSNDIESFIIYFLGCLKASNIEEVNILKLPKINEDPLLIKNVLFKWIKGVDISQVKNEWLLLDNDVLKLNVLISEGFYYRYTWLATAFIYILADILKLNKDELPSYVRNFPSFVKYGLNSEAACLACSLGIRSREVATILSEKFHNSNEIEFDNWLSNLTQSDIASCDFSKYDIQNVINVSEKLIPGSLDLSSNDVVFDVLGIENSSTRMNLSLSIKEGDILSARNITNTQDSFNIMLYYEDQELGLIPRNIAKAIATDLELNFAVYNMWVQRVIEKNHYNEVKVSMKRYESN